MIHSSQLWKPHFQGASYPAELEGISWLEMIFKRVQNEPLPPVLAMEIPSNDETTKLDVAEQINEEHLLQWNDLILICKVSEQEGWYMTADFVCYYVRVEDWEQKLFTVVYPHISYELLMTYFWRVG